MYFAFSCCLYFVSFLSLFPFHSDSQRLSYNLPLYFEAVKAFSAVLGKSTYEQWLYLPEKKKKKAFWRNLFSVQKTKKKIVLFIRLAHSRPATREGHLCSSLITFPLGGGKMEPFQRLCMVRGSNLQPKCASWWIFEEMPFWTQSSQEVFFNTSLFNSYDKERERGKIKENQIAAFNLYMKDLTTDSKNYLQAFLIVPSWMAKQLSPSCFLPRFLATLFPIQTAFTLHISVSTREDTGGWEVLWIQTFLGLGHTADAHECSCLCLMLSAADCTPVL